VSALPAYADRHPWLDSFVAEPLSELTRLLAGRAAVYPYTGADPVDAARMLFGGLHPDDPARPALSTAILDWLNNARRAALPAEPAVQQRDLGRIIAVFEIVGALTLIDAAEPLRRQYVRWWEWVDRMPGRSARDPKSAYLRMLVNTQMSLKDRFSDPDGLSPLWMRICTEAGRSLPQIYLQIALAGLRKLPQALARGDTPWITGLAEWALANNPSGDQFLAVWRPLKKLYPSSPALLRRQVYSLISQPAFKDAGIEPPGWWRADKDFPDHQDRGKFTFEPPAKDAHESILDALRAGHPLRLLEPRLRQLMESHRLYAARSGDPDYLVRTFCNVGKTLIKTGADAHEDRIRFAESLAREALNYRPFDVFSWALWRDALAAGGAYESARDVGWEIIRRFPNNAVTRTELAELMISGGEAADALGLVRSSIEDGIFDPATYNLLSRLEAAHGDMTKARAAAAEALKLEPDNMRRSEALARLTAGVRPTLESAHFRIGKKVERIGEGAALEEIVKSGRLRALREQLRVDPSALTRLSAALREDPESTYVNLLAARHRLWCPEEDALPPVAAAFELALAEEDRAKLERLAERAPRLTALIHLARALFGDEESADYIARLLATVDERQLVQGEKIIKHRLGQMIDEMNSGVAALDAISGDRRRVMRALYDANEALAAPELMAA
jgi:tetratricopeptide (TPR) repeat protein